MSRSYPMLAARVFGTPLAVSVGRLEPMLAYLTPRILGEATPAEPFGVRAAKHLRAAAHAQEGLGVAELARAAGGRLAVIPVHGALALRGGVDAASNDLRAYDAIRQELRAAVADSSVQGILLDIDSPGGEVAGLPELAADIKAARQAKPVFAVANTDALSAAYWLASSAEKVFATPSASVGSIGVVAAHVDRSGEDASAGRRYTFIHAGAQKVDGNSHAPLTPAVHARVQAEVDRLYGEFVAHVAQARGVDAARVRGTEAGVLSADEALRLGLVDAVGTFDQAVAALAARVSNSTTSAPRARGAKGMELTPEAAALVAEKDRMIAEQAARLAAFEAAEKAAREKAEAERKSAHAAAVEQLKADAVAAQAPIPEEKLALVRAAYERGDEATAVALADALRDRALALGSGTPGATRTVTLGPKADAGHDNDIEAFKARWKLNKKGS